MMDSPWHLYLMAGMYMLAGLMHFLFPKVYLKVMPPYLPAPKFLVYTSGIAEILLGIGLFYEKSRDLTIFGIILMLTIFLLVHIHMLTDPKASGGLPKWLLIARIPIQFGLIFWAYSYL